MEHEIRTMTGRTVTYELDANAREYMAKHEPLSGDSWDDLLESEGDLFHGVVMHSAYGLMARLGNLGGFAVMPAGMTFEDQAWLTASVSAVFDSIVGAPHVASGVLTFKESSITGEGDWYTCPLPHGNQLEVRLGSPAWLVMLDALHAQYEHGIDSDYLRSLEDEARYCYAAAEIQWRNDADDWGDLSYMRGMTHDERLDVFARAQEPFAGDAGLWDISDAIYELARVEDSWRGPLADWAERCPDDYALAMSEFV